MRDRVAVLVTAVDALEAVGAVCAVTVVFDRAGVAVVLLGDHGGFLRDLGGAIGVAEIFTALRAGPIFDVAGGKAGSRHSVVMHRRMSGGGDAFRVSRAAAAYRTGIGLNARAGTGGLCGHAAGVPRMRDRAAVLITAVDALEAVGRGLAVAVASHRAGVAVGFLGHHGGGLRDLGGAVGVAEIFIAL